MADLPVWIFRHFFYISSALFYFFDLPASGTNSAFKSG